MNRPIEDILKHRFGHDALYPLQRLIVDRVTAGRDALVVMPTGAGKSLCFQLPALALPGKGGADSEARGVALVFSPLIALMEDQVAALRKKGIDAAYINSTLDRNQREERMAGLARGDYELIYATPERMDKPAFVDALLKVPGGVKLLAVDEAHCISKWGHDLRPAYQRIGEFRRLLGNPLTIALTATATPRVREDIRAVIGVTEEEMPLFAAPIERPNLSYRSDEVWSDKDRAEHIVERCRETRGTGIVYYALIKHLEHARREITAALEKAGIDRRIQTYHGKLDPKDKKRVYRRFINAKPDDGLLLLATNAFGMGVDKPDIRFIVHAQIPSSVEAYAQETGRAGRDGEPSTCQLLFAQDDIAVQRQFIEWMNPPAHLLAEIGHAIDRRYGDAGHADFDHDELYLDVIGKGRGDGRFEYALITLEKLGVIEPTSAPGRYRPVRPLTDDDLDPEAIEEKKKQDLLRLLDVVHLARAGDIKSYIHDYFKLDPTPIPQ